MQTKDQAIEYKALLQKIKSEIDDIATLGVDTKPYYDALNTIINTVESNTNNKYREGSTAVMFLEQDYSTGIRHLRSLDTILQKYNIYFVIINTCNYLDIWLKEEITDSDLEKYSNLMIEMLNSLRNSDTLKYSEEQNIVERVYDIAYQLIKLEIIKFGDSKIYEASKKHDIDLSFFNECIKKELDTINLNEPKYEVLKKEIYNVKSKGIGNSYFDINIIKMIIALGTGSNIKERLKQQVFELKNEIEASNLELAKKLRRYRGVSDSKNSKVKDLKHNRKQIAKSLLSVILGISIYAGIGAGTVLGLKKICQTKNYNKKTTTYSEYNLYQEENEDVKFGVSEDWPVNKIVIKQYGDWNKDGETTVRVYDVSEYDFDTLKEYLSISLQDLSYEEFEYNTKEGNTGNIIVEKTSYEFVEESTNLLPFVFGLLFAILMEFMSALLTECFILDDMDWAIYNRIEWLKDNFNNLKRSRKLKLEAVEELRKSVLELMEEISKNNKLKEAFNKMIKDNKFIIDLDKSLQESISGVDFSYIEIPKQNGKNELVIDMNKFLNRNKSDSNNLAAGNLKTIVKKYTKKI